MPRCWIALGGNEGDVPATFPAAMADLSQTVGNIELSPIYGAAPMGEHAGGDFTNAVAGFDTVLPPEELLCELQRIESARGRRRGLHWGPRTLDLDLIYYGDQRLQSDRLTVPHPGRIYRRFVLDPLCDLAATWIDPHYEMSVAALRQRLIGPPRRCAFGNNLDSAVCAAVAAFVTRRWPDVVVERTDAPAHESTGLVISANPQDAEATPVVVLPLDLESDAAISFLQAAATAAFDAPQPIA